MSKDIEMFFKIHNNEKLIGVGPKGFDPLAHRL